MAARTNVRTMSPKAIFAKLAEHDAALDAAENDGVIPSARLNMATNPSNTNTVVIGGHTFTFLTTLVAAGATTQVKILGSAALTRAELIKAINGTTSANVVPATTPHTKPIVADLIDTTRVRIRLADAKGGSPVTAAKAATTANIAVSETLADAADVWDRANLNETGRASAAKEVTTSVAITAAHIAAGKVYIEMPFTPLEVTWQARSAAGVLLNSDDVVSIEGNAIKIALAGGSAPNLVATNIVTVVVTG